MFRIEESKAKRRRDNTKSGVAEELKHISLVMVMSLITVLKRQEAFLLWRKEAAAILLLA